MPISLLSCKRAPDWTSARGGRADQINNRPTSILMCNVSTTTTLSDGESSRARSRPRAERLLQVMHVQPREADDDQHCQGHAPDHEREPPAPRPSLLYIKARCYSYADEFVNLPMLPRHWLCLAGEPNPSSDFRNAMGGWSRGGRQEVSRPVLQRYSTTRSVACSAPSHGFEPPWTPWAPKNQTVALLCVRCTASGQTPCQE